MGVELITAIVGAATTILSSILTFFFTKKKYSAEVDSNVIDNLQKALDLYKQIADDNLKRIGELQEENRDLRKQVNELSMQVNKLLNSICLDLTCKYRKLQEEHEQKAPKEKKNSVQKHS